MKKTLVLIAVLVFSLSTFAQKFGYVDTEYILQNIPSFEASQKKLDEYSAEWQKEIEDIYADIERMYKEYQAEKVLLTEDLRIKRENEIIAREKEAKELQKKYFGQEGELYQKRQELIKPIQDDIYNAIKEVAAEANLDFIFDSGSSSVNILFANPKFDRSDEVLQKLGYKN
ncbi:MAG: OmpH family outer membrane protein [Bacteroidales bacterium]|nr:OmpH family outer membrane protein [Bacteroidales bacterium]